MKPYRITSLEVTGGPLTSAFKIEEAKGFNLIYGHNETGKTTIVESLIKWLFGTGRNSAWSADDLRKINVAGQVCVQGKDPESDAAVHLSGTTPDAKRFGAWFESAGLPPDMSRLLVVRSGEPRIISETADGVGKDVVKNYLIGSGMLQEVLDSIPAVVKNPNTKIKDGAILGNNQGVIRDHRALKEKLKELTELLEAVQNRTGGELDDLIKRLGELEAELEKQMRSKRHLAWKLSEEIKRIKRKLGEYPPIEEIERIHGKIGRLKQVEEEIAILEVNLGGSRKILGDYLWLTEAVKQYEELISRQGNSVRWPLIMVGLAFAATVAGGVLGKLAVLIGGAGAVLVFSIIQYVLSAKTVHLSPGEEDEMVRIHKEYERRFGEELGGLSMLRAKMEELNPIQGKILALEEQLKALREEAVHLRNDIDLWFKTKFTGQFEGVVTPDVWEEKIILIKGIIRGLQRQLAELTLRLAALNVPPEQYLEEDPEVEYDSEEIDRTTDKIAQIEREIETLEAADKELKQEVIAAVGQAAASWLELINLLEEKLAETRTDYREKTAKLLAMICVRDVAEEFDQIEQEEINDAFRNDPVLNETLSSLTAGAYSHFEWRDQMIYASPSSTQKGGPFPQTQLSKGAGEQALLALRIGFARRKLGDRAAFLILDDAFQHADWQRRPEMIRNILQLVKDHNWQVFYFTMDDNIRDTFRREADGIIGEDRYLYRSLSEDPN